MESKRKTARIAGALYLLMAVTGLFGIMYVPSTIIVSGDATASVNNILASELLFRAGIVSNLICQTTFIFLVTVLYRLFKEVNKKHALLMLALVVVSVPIAFLNMLNQIIALQLLSGSDFLKAFEPEQLNALVMVFLNLYTEGIAVVEIFWGLWLLPFGLLVFKSGFVPRIFGVLLMLACFAYLTESVTHLLFPRYGHTVMLIVSMPQAVGELAMMLWLLIKGVKDEKTVAFQVG